MMDGQSDGRTDRRTVGRSDGRTTGQTDGRTDGRTVGRTDRRTLILLFWLLYKNIHGYFVTREGPTNEFFQALGGGRFLFVS